MSTEEQQQNSWNVVALQHAIELTQHIKKNWQSDHYSDELVVCARRFYLHIKKTFEENVRTSKEWREFREKLQEEILILLVDNRHGRQGSDFSATNLKKIVNPGGSADSKFAGAICAYICFKISHEIFQEHIIISNRLSSLLMEAHDNNKNRTFQRKDILISELMMLVYSTCMSGMAIWPATSKFDELLFVEDQVKRYHACLFYFHMASKHPIDFYRNHFRSAMRRNGRKTDKIVAKLIRIVCESVNSEHNEMRVAAFSALKAILNLVASRETALSEGRNWPKDLVNSIIEGLKNTESDRIGPILCCYLLVDISAAKNNYTNSLKTCLKKLRIAQTWNPCAQKNKTEKFFDAVFKYDLVEEALQNPMGGTRFTNLQPNSSTAERLLDENVETLSRLVLSQRSMKNSINIHPYLLPLLPKLCAFNPKKFEPFFVKTIEYCLQEIAPSGNQKTTTRRNQGTALLSMGMIIHLICESDSELADPTTRPTTVLEEQIDTKVIPKLKSVLKEAFISFQMSRGGVDCDPTLFQCIELISISLTDLHKKLWFKPQNKEFLNMIVAFGLIEIKDSWIRCVQSLNSKISRDQVSHGMEQVLLKNLFNERLPSQIMNGYSDDHSCLSSLSVLIPFKNGEDFDFGRVSVRKRIASLKALEMFEFTDFSRYKKLIYRWKEYFNPKEKIQVKIAAAKAVTRVLRLFIIHSSTCGPNLVGETTISNIIRKLLQIADTIIPYKQESQSTQLKLAIYRSLKPEFDAYLIHQHNLERIMNAIHQPYPIKEENFTDRLEVQEAVMEIIGRLNAMNAAETMPHIRMMINDLWTQLQMPDQASARLLEVLFRHANQAQLSLFVDPTIRQIEPLLSYEYVQSYPPRMTCTLIDCLSAISAVNGPRLEKETLNRFFSLIYRLLVETTEPTVKVSALRCLSSLIEHHNYVISPYFKHRKLMDDMLALVTADKKTMQHEINEEALRMIGRLGALDPYQYKEITKKRRSNSQNEKHDGFTSINEMLVNDSRCPDEKFIIRVAVELIKAKLSHGGDVTAPLHSLDNLIQHAGTNILPHLGKVMPELHRIAQDHKAKKEIKSNILGLFEKLLQKMRRRVLPFMDDIKETMETQKDISYAPLRKKLAQLIYQAAYNLQYEFKDYMSWAVRYILELFEKLKSSTDPQDEEATIYLVRAIGKFGYIEAHYSVLLRPLATMLQSPNSSDQLRGEILVVLEARIVRTAMPDYFMILSEAILVALAYEVSADKHTVIKNHGPHSSKPTKDYDLRETAVNCLRYMRSGMRHFNLWEEEYDDYFQIRTGNLWKPSEDPEMVFQDNAFKNDFSQDQSMIKEGEDEHDTAHYNWLKEEFEVDCQTPEDFKDLQVRISKCFLSHSKSAVIRGLRGMDRLYNVPVNLIIFNCSFYAMWAEPKPVRELQMDGSESTRIPEDPIKPYRDHITKGLLKIIDGKNTDPPRGILSFFLDLAHFLELSDIDKERLDQPGGSLKAFGGLNGIGKLADCAERTDAYAKALHYREMEFLYKISEKDNREKERKIAESLIKSFQKLGEQEAAEGVLEFAKSNDITVNAEWFEKLNRWEEAKKRYADGNDNPYDQLGYMRCLEALGEWDELCAKVYEFDEEIEDQKIESVKLGTTAAWHLGNWDEFQRLHSIIPVNSFDGAFYRAVHSVQHSRYDEARKWTMEARKDLETSLTMQDKNYSRVYGTVFNAQLCSELEEVIEHRTANRQRQIAIQEMWESRLCGTSSDDGQRVDGVQLVIEEWQKILLLRSLVKERNTAAFPRDDTEEHFNIRSMLKFMSLAAKSGRTEIARQTIKKILPNIDNWNYVEMLSYPGLIENAQGRQVSLKISPPKIRALYKYVKHVAIPHLQVTPKSEEKGIQIITRLCDDLKPLKNRLKDLRDRERMSDDERIVIAITYCRQAEMRRNTVPQPNQIPHLTKKVGEIKDLYMTAIDALNKKDIQSREFVKRRYKAVHSYANFALDSVRRIREGDAQTVRKLQHPRENSSQDDQEKAAELFKQIRSPIYKEIANFSVDALKYFYESVKLSQKSVLQDMLRILNIMAEINKDLEDPETSEFMHASEGRLLETIRTEPLSCDPERWLKVVPQLIAIMDMKKVDNIPEILAHIGEKHAQGILWSLIYAQKNPTQENERQSDLAKSIINRIRDHSKNLVKESEMISTELVSVAMLWIDQWNEALEDILQKFYCQQNNQELDRRQKIEYIKRRMRGLHEMVLNTQQTRNLSEVEFKSTFHENITSADRHLRRLLNGDETESDLEDLMRKYQEIKRKIKDKASGMTKLDLKKVSTKLLEVKDMELAIPGTYQPGMDLVRIHSVASEIEILKSKQKPRKIFINGSDGQRHQFLLKGKEDLRLDERVMQLFDLMNSLIKMNNNLRQKDIEVIKYSIIPMTNENGLQSGLVRWIDNSETINELLKWVRQKRLNVTPHPEKEHEKERLPQDSAIQNCSILQKVEMFHYVQKVTEDRGYDLARILWLQSASADIWFERRTNFVCSLALMSMVGYILGLGDRHVSNILIITTSGKVAHIDFGDSFENAMKREHVPEKVPFRLTRMLVNAMEVTGVDGTFKKICLESIDMCRSNKESILAVLEAFINDPVVAESQHRRVQKHGQISVEADDAKVKIQRVTAKLEGKDFNEVDENTNTLSVKDQVERLIYEARNIENLCQHYTGWCIYW